MRLTIGAQASDIEQTNQFAKWLLDIGEGNVGGSNDGEATIDIPHDLLINDSYDPIQSLIDFVYPSILQNIKNIEFFRERAILAPTNEDVQDINDRLISLFPRDEKVYLGSDSICPTEDFVDPLQANIYSPDVLNGLKISGLPNHRLVLKVISLKKHVVVAEIISGGNIGTRTYIHRVNMIPTDNKIPFKFQRRQFPISVCFAMTINKSQGQSLSKVGLYLKHPVFSHGQLYVALSRVKSRDGVKLLIFDADDKLTNKTSNVVYKEIF
ncbi:ATP-dependent DNA helicase PIF1-like [Bidens hawaiensis]|uniref:ATP-dependent DNA helicase PIF1-like n=1 Tax=Bidens hawaiensis TaxID=980011 RepID=UPI0040492512